MFNLDRKCAICGKELLLEIANDTRKILSGGEYFGTIKTETGKEVEYWECSECYSDVNKGEQEKIAELLKNSTEPELDNELCNQIAQDTLSILTRQFGYRKLPDRPELREEIVKIFKEYETERPDDEGVNLNRPDLWDRYVSEDDYGEVADRILALLPNELPEGDKAHSVWNKRSGD